MLKEVKLSSRDKAHLDTLAEVVESIALAMGQSTEVVLHSFEDLGHSMLRIANSHISGRQPGSPMTDRGLEILHRRETLGDGPLCYFVRNEEGRTMRIITQVVRNPEGKMIGLLGINTDLSRPFLEHIRGFVPSSEEPSEVIVERFPPTVQDLIHGMLADSAKKHQNRGFGRSGERARRIVSDLYRRGVFDVRGTVGLVAKELGLSRHSVYNYIREARLEEEYGSA